MFSGGINWFIPSSIKNFISCDTDTLKVLVLQKKTPEKIARDLKKDEIFINARKISV